MDNEAFGQAAGIISSSQDAAQPQAAATLGTSPGTRDPNVEVVAAQLEQQIQRSANWFFFIAALSLINTVVALSGSDRGFALGLMMTQVVDYMASSLGSAGKAAAMVIDLIFAGIFVLFGCFARKLKKWAFLAGMGIYLCDTLLALLGRDILGIAIHAYALWALYSGLSRISKLRKLREFGLTSV